MAAAANQPHRVPQVRVELYKQKSNLLGRITRFIRYSLYLLFLSFSPINWALPGDLDNSFGGAFGRYFINVLANAYDGAQAVARQDDGKLVIVGTCGDGTSANFCIVRRNADGSADASFGNPALSMPGLQIIAMTGFADHPSAVLIEPSGHIVVGGTCVAFSVRSFCLLRLTPAGFTDASFGASGRVNQVVGAGDASITALLRQPDGKYVLTGSCFDGDRNTFCAARFLSNGAFDMSFGIQGRRLFPLGSETLGFGATLRSDGSIVIAGSCNAGASMCAGKLTSSGNVDNSFGVGGVAIASNGGNDVARAIALQADGKMVLAGRCPLNSQFAFCATRLNDDGSPDGQFGPTGAPDRVVRFSMSASLAEANAVSLQADGRILMVGSCTGATSDFCLLRLNDNGTADEGFGSFGAVKTNVIDAADFGNATLVQPDGKVVVVGQCSDSSAPNDASMCVARYVGGPLGARNCSFDIDGDGAVLGTTDLLILNRISAGMQLRRAVNGIVFSPNATRRTWPDIRAYLRSQCDQLIVD
jgi:uncharacterized delta-60 repeat protein